MSKIKILVVPSDRTGVGEFRSVKPHITLEEMYPDDIHVDIDYEPQWDNDEWLKQYDIIHYHRTFGPYEQMENTITRLKNLGIVSIMDLDDYWAPGRHHPAYLLIKHNEIDKKIMKNLTLAENITTTTSEFRKEINKLNKNVFVLPNAINTDDRQFKPKPVKSDRIRIGWLGGSCLTPDTEILTDQGWKYFQDLDETEKVATLNPNTNEVEYHKPNNYIEEDHDGDIYICDTNEVSFSTTGNHNMYASKVKNLTHKKLDFKLDMQENLYGSNYHVKKDGINTNPDVEYFILPGLEKNGNKHDYSEKKILMDEWLMFFGFWLGDGWTDKNNNCVSIAQYKDNDFLSILFNILEKNNLGPNFIKTTQPSHTGLDPVVRMCHKQLYQYLKDFGKAWDKFIPRELLNTLSERQLNILLEWYLKADGSSEITGDYKRRRGYTVSKQLADDLMELAFKVGDAASIKNRGLRTPRTTLKENGGERVITPRHEAYQIGFYDKNSKHNKLTPLIKTEKIRKEHYTGKVRCVNVDNHIIHIRRNGKALWVGNSHEEDLKLLKGLVNKLSADGLMDKVQFVLCGFDTRGQVTMINEQTGEQSTRDIKPTESVWFRYESIFTDGYKTISSKYRDHLLTFTQEEYPDHANEAYRRVWTKPIGSYATNYNLFDISLAPLDDNIFNKVKSQLKVIEAGIFNKALIAQDFGPYKIDLINALDKGGMINPEGNALLVDGNKNHKQWYQHIKRLINNPELVTQLSDNLHKLVSEKYELKVVTKDRYELYKKLLKK